MNNKTLTISLVVIIALIGGYVVFTSGSSQQTAQEGDAMMEKAMDDSSTDTMEGDAMDEQSMDEHMQTMDDGQTVMAMAGAVNPATLYVSPGQQLILANHESFDVALTSDDGSIQTDTAAAGESIMFTAPDQIGTYAYMVAGYPNMTGTIVVEE